MRDYIFKLLTTEIKKANEIINDEAKIFIDDYEGPFSEEIKNNILIAESKGLPLCQDTGIIEFFVFLPKFFNISFDIEKLLNDVVLYVYKNNFYRYSTVKDPLFERVNLGNNSPSIVHYMFHDKKFIEIRFLVKGGGSENLSALFMLKPTSSKEDIKKIICDYIKNNGMRGCPPLNIGIGIGGSSDKAVVLSKLALTYDFNNRNDNIFYSDFEKELIEDLNDLKIGFQGLGSGRSVYSVHINYFPTHIAVLPLAISIDCYLVRKGCVRVEV